MFTGFALCYFSNTSDRFVKNVSDDIYKEKNMSTKSNTGFFAFLLGGAIGAVVGLLYAPRSGEETRQILTEEGKDLMNKTRNSVSEAQESAMATLQSAQERLAALNLEAKERLTKLQDIAKETLDEQKKSLEKGYSQEKEVVTEEPHDEKLKQTVEEIKETTNDMKKKVKAEMA